MIGVGIKREFGVRSFPTLLLRKNKVRVPTFQESRDNRTFILNPKLGNAVVPTWRTTPIFLRELTLI
ncbi:hypothetical protein LEP1GSC039_1924 [Leptospira santarosai str. 2000027870]|nr:hypothetical protein LEP1GSC039_1924 [Leptospira santarosai str. 2000027870]